MLVSTANQEVFHGMSRNKINELVSKNCKTDNCREKRQTATLESLKEIWPLTKFKLTDLISKPIIQIPIKSRL